MTSHSIIPPALSTHNSRLKIAFYIDGFNLYHALDELDPSENYCKWLDLYKLAENFANRYNADLKKVVFCTATPTHKGIDVKDRHRTYIEALKYSKVCVKSGWFLKIEKECRSCGAKWDEYSEKEGDVNLAVSLVEDAFNDIYDVAFLLTSDSDQRPSIETVNNITKSKKQVIMAYPDWRNNTTASSNLANECNNGFKHINKNSVPIKIEDIKKSLFGTYVFDKRGIIKYPKRRPREYDPPTNP